MSGTCTVRELQGIVLCRNRDCVLLTNDRRAKNFCKREDIAYFDAKGILRSFYRKKVLNKEEIRSLVKEIEEKDNTRIKGVWGIFECDRHRTRQWGQHRRHLRKGGCSLALRASLQSRLLAVAYLMMQKRRTYATDRSEGRNPFAAFLFPFCNF